MSETSRDRRKDRVEIGGYRIEQTRFVTEFRGPEEKQLFRSGRFVGTLVIPEGERPFPDRDAVYEVVEVHKVSNDQINADEAVFDAMGIDDE